MDKKKIIICVVVLVFLAGIITVGILTENNGEDKNDTTTVTNQIEENKTEEKPSANNDETETTPVNTETSEPQILTIENCDDLANLLINDSSDVIKAFVEKYKDKTIEFDGHIAAVSNHNDYKTRYDILMYAGDYVKESAKGPNFKFEDINTNDLGIDDLYLPAFVNAGSNVRIVAEVENYNDVSGVLNLDPISIQSR